jgi:hypothetical protein
MYKYIISLTTIPSKFDYLYLAMDSMVKQTVVADVIIINIPKTYDFRLTGEISQEKINDFLGKYSKYNVVINMVEKDDGPGTKILGLLKNNILDKDKINEDTYLILLDDDFVYKPYLIEYFDKDINVNKDIDVATYYSYNYNNINVAQAADAMIFKYNIINNFLDYYDIIKDEDYLFYHDDFFISYFFYLKNKNIQYIPPPYGSLIYDWHEFSKIDSLFHLEGKYNRNNLNMKSSEILNNLKNNNKFICI